MSDIDKQRGGSPTFRPPQLQSLGSVLARNISALKERRAREEAQATREEKVAERITRFTGSMLFVYIHIAIFTFWIAANAGLIPNIPRWDESFVILGTGASVEAIFLSTFVLISQNRMAAASDKRSELDLQISLLAEHEITKMATMMSSLVSHFGLATPVDAEVPEIQRDVSAEAVLDGIESVSPNKKP
jgi:uncharacterized membrane protein